MSMSTLVSSAAMKTVVQQLDDAMKARGVSETTRGHMLEIFQMSYAYIPYVIAQKKDPTDVKVLMEFLAIKNKHLAKLLGNEAVDCGIAMVDFIGSVRTAAVATKTGFPPAIVLSYGLALIDLLEVGNSCSFAQQAYYEAVLRSSNVKLVPIRKQSKMFKVRP